jgi:hypothetical protein
MQWTVQNAEWSRSGLFKKWMHNDAPFACWANTSSMGALGQGREMRGGRGEAKKKAVPSREPKTEIMEPKNALIIWS